MFPNYQKFFIQRYDVWPWGGGVLLERGMDRITEMGTQIGETGKTPLPYMTSSVTNKFQC